MNLKFLFEVAEKVNSLNCSCGIYSNPNGYWTISIHSGFGKMIQISEHEKDALYRLELIAKHGVFGRK